MFDSFAGNHSAQRIPQNRNFAIGIDGGRDMDFDLLGHLFPQVFNILVDLVLN